MIKKQIRNLLAKKVKKNDILKGINYIEYKLSSLLKYYTILT